MRAWPYDIHSYVDVAPLLAAEGYRVIVPHLRSYGTTTFRSSDTFRLVLIPGGKGEGAGMPAPSSSPAQPSPSW